MSILQEPNTKKIPTYKIFFIICRAIMTLFIFVVGLLIGLNVLTASSIVISIIGIIGLSAVLYICEEKF